MAAVAGVIKRDRAEAGRQTEAQLRHRRQAQAADTGTHLSHLSERRR